MEKIEMPKISYCLPSKSNLRYLKTCIPSIRNNASRPDHDIIIFVDADDDGTVKWLEEVTEEYGLTVLINPNLGKSLYGIGKAYDACVEASTTEIFTIFHADMILGKDADLNAYNHLERGTVVASTRVEPPLHINNGEKILKDFGMYPEELDHEKFNEFVEQNKDNGDVTDGIFAPWMMYKEDHKAIGGHDTRMHSCREDSDIFNRMSLAGYKFVQPWNSLVYHLAGRGAGSFGAADTEADKKRHEEWKTNMNNSTREFVRKWHSSVKHTALMKPVVSPIYNTGIKITNANAQLLGTLEPWCDDIYVDCDYSIYAQQEQDLTVDILAMKIHDHSQEPDNHVVIDIDGRSFTQQDFLMLQDIGPIIKQSGQIGRSLLGKNMIITINELEEQQDKLIKI